MTTFKLNIGDWSRDGHNQSETFFVESNKDFDDVCKAYRKAKKKLPDILCPENFMNEYEDHGFSEEVYEAALKAGHDMLEGYKYDPKYADSKYNDGPPTLGWRDRDTYDRYESGELFKYPDWDANRMAEYTIWFMMRGDPDLKLSLKKDAKMPEFPGYAEGGSIGQIGYGLFGA
jgi:hypothetical protein